VCVVCDVFVEHPRIFDNKAFPIVGTIHENRVLVNGVGYPNLLSFMGSQSTKLGLCVAVDLFMDLLDCGHTGKSVSCENLRV
jgi:hypothetical protein